VGSEFILHYEVTKYFAEMAGEVHAQSLDFDRAAAETQQWSKDRLGHKASRNTRRRYLVVRGAKQESVTFIRVQRFGSPDYFVSEAKGAARSILKYGFVESAIMVGVGGWPTDPTGHTVPRAYQTISSAFKAPPMTDLILELPDQQFQVHFGEVPPIMLARIQRAG
jgi:hypothetical protein